MKITKFVTSILLITFSIVSNSKEKLHDYGCNEQSIKAELNYIHTDAFNSCISQNQIDFDDDSSLTTKWKYPQNEFEVKGDNIGGVKQKNYECNFENHCVNELKYSKELQARKLKERNRHCSLYADSRKASVYRRLCSS